MLRGLRDALTDLNMTLLETAEAHGSLARRGSQLKYFAHLSPDAIISFSNDQTPLRDQFVALANSRSKLILGVDMPPDLPEYACASCVATNEPEKGRLAGRLLASELIRRKRRRVGAPDTAAAPRRCKCRFISTIPFLFQFKFSVQGA